MLAKLPIVTAIKFRPAMRAYRAYQILLLPMRDRGPHPPNPMPMMKMHPSHGSKILYGSHNQSFNGNGAQLRTLHREATGSEQRGYNKDIGRRLTN
ncbi:hypothetical protein TNCT_348951 [Trichonephila clavata]|uniref:Uncharacterized protein n=1 Tax=Trichonephila clavata TaxID=2740835 RepID=A0A8X6FQL8_TRICU|nr:hypothetical protein TNCT_348951 [Trichonephila clavata]